MIGKLKSVVLDARDIDGLAAFYGELAGWSRTYADDEWITTVSDDGWRVCFQLAPDHVPPRWPDPAHPQQFHLDVEVDADGVDAAEAAALAIGARRLSGEGANWRVYADPADKPFCLVWTV
jgi:hypothetical protein